MPEDVLAKMEYFDEREPLYPFQAEFARGGNFCSEA